MFEYDRQIVFPFTVARCAWIVGDHRRAALPEYNARHGCDQRRNR
jgi:hypothetical protein